MLKAYDISPLYGLSLPPLRTELANNDLSNLEKLDTSCCHSVTFLLSGAICFLFFLEVAATTPGGSGSARALSDTSSLHRMALTARQMGDDAQSEEGDDNDGGGDTSSRRSDTSVSLVANWSGKPA